MAIIYMLVGIPGSGKSTFAKSLAAIEDIDIISSDTIRNLHPSWEEEKIFPEVYRLIAKEIESNKNVIYDATNSTPAFRHRLIENLEQYNIKYDIGVYYFDTSYEECYRRVEIRNTLPNQRYFPLDKLKGYSDNLVEPDVKEGFIFVKKLHL